MFGGWLPSIRRIDIGGGHTRAIRCTDANSADTAEPTAAQKCQFGGFSRASRLSFRREKCHLCHLRHIAALNRLKLNSTSEYIAVF